MSAILASSDGWSVMLAASDPAVRAVAGVADHAARKPGEQNQREAINRPREFFQQLIIERGRRHAERRSRATHQTSCIIRSCAPAEVVIARAVKHHQPQRQQGGDAKRQSCDGDFHFKVSKQMPAAICPHLLRGRGARRRLRRGRCGRHGSRFAARARRLQPSPEFSISGRP